MNPFMMLTAYVTALLTDGVSGIDVSVVDSILEVTRTILGMFTIFPLNVFLTAAIVFIGVKVFRKLVKAV
ncbi:MAG: hypothetical protein IJW75_00890 [Alphaproteobacteria bacterium]|nr:hypothetical protein [Alphaproteobacteria bacterium]